MEPFGVAPSAHWRSRPGGQVAVLGAIIAVAAGFAPAIVPLVLLLAVAWALGSVLMGASDARWRVLLVAVEAVGVALLLTLPWVVGTVLAGKASVGIFGLPLAGATSPGWGDVLRFAVGPAARSPLAWLLVVAAALPLLLGRGPRLVWATRLWVLALGSWGLAFAAYRGAMGSFAPSETVVLVPAALAVAACVGLAISAFENDLSESEFGWRQLVSVATLVLVVLGLLPVAAAAAGGRWDLPSQGVEQPLGFLSRPSPSVARVLWLGDPRALPVGGWSVEPGLAFSLTPEDLPDSAQVLTPAGSGPAVVTADAVRLALSGGTVHLGRLLAPVGVRYVVVVDGLAPSLVGSATPSVSAPLPPGVQEDLLQQDDLQVVPGEVGVQVYQVGENMPVTASRGAPLPAVRVWSYPGATDVVGWQPVLGDLGQGQPATGEVPAGTLYAGYAPAGNFALTQNGHGAARRSAFGWAAQYRVAAGRASLSFSRFPFVPLVVLLEMAAWIALAAALVGHRPRSRGASHAAAAR